MFGNTGIATEGQVVFRVVNRRLVDSAEVAACCLTVPYSRGSVR